MTDTFGIPMTKDWSPRWLGQLAREVRWRKVDFTGYRTPMVSFGHDGLVLMFDGHLPEVEGGWPALQQDLGDPEAKLDYVNGLLGDTPGGEWVYPNRGITVFVNKDASRLIHVAVYPPTTVERWQHELRFSLEMKRLPRSGAR